MNYSNVAKTTLVNAVMLALYSTSSPVIAQSSDTRTELDELEVIEVRGTPMSRYYTREAQAGTKTLTDIMDIPRAVTLIPEQAIIDQQATTLEQMIRNVSGTSPTNGQGGTYDDYSVRGFRANTTFRDGFPGLTTRLSAATIESLEVLKGPASVLYGAVQPGGVVNVVTKKPQAEDYHLLHASFDEHGKRYFLADSTGVLYSSDSWLYRLVAGAEESDSFRDNVTSKRRILSPSLRWYLSDDTFFNLNIEYQQDNRPIDHGVIASFVNNDPSLAIRPIDSDYSKTYNEGFAFKENESISSVLDFNSVVGNEWNLAAKFAAQKSDGSDLESRPAATIHGYKVYLNNMLAGDLSPLAALGLKPAPDGTLLRNVTGDRSRSHNYYTGVTLDKVLMSAWGEHRFLFGAEWQNSDQLSKRWDGQSQTSELTAAVLGVRRALFQGDMATAASIANGIPGQFFNFSVYAPTRGLLSPELTQKKFDFKSNSKRAGLYVQDQISVTEELLLLAGARYDYYDGEVKTLRFGRGIDSRGQHSDSQMSYQFGGLYHWGDNTSVFASYSESFTPQSFGNLTFGNKADAKPLLTPELGKQFEVGAKLSWLDDKLTLTTAYYRIKKRNILTLVPSASGEVVPTLIGEKQSKGIELDLTVQLDEGLNLIASFSKLKPEISDVGESAVNNGGNRPHNVADTTGSLWLSYEPKVAGNATWGLAGGVFYTGDRFGDDANTWSMNTYHTVELGAWYYLPFGDEQLKLHASIKNLFDKRYILASGNTKERLRPGQPRTINFSVSWMF